MLNCIEIKKFDSEKFADNYKIFKIYKTDDTNYINDNIKIIYSTVFDTRENFYVLTSSNTRKEDVLSVFPDQHYKIENINPNNINQNFLINLFINKRSNRSLSLNNLSAELYRIIDKKKDQKICLSFSVNSKNVFLCKVSTFSILNNKTKKKFTYKTQKAIDQNKLTFYTHNDEYVYRSATHIEKDPYINRSISRKKNTFDYFTIDISDSKVFEMFRLLREINNEDSSIIELGFKDVSYNRILEDKRTSENTYKQIVERLGNDIVINVVDYCDKKIEIETLLQKDNINYSFSNKVKDDQLNIAIIRSAKEYKETDEEDEHQLSNKTVVQNIIYSSLSQTVLKQCWLELLIKSEVINKKIKAVSLPGEWYFYKFINKTLHHMKVIDNQIIELTSFNHNEYIKKIMEENKDSDPKVIVNSKGYIVILETDLRLIPNLNIIEDSQDDYIIITDGKRKNKIRSNRNKYFGESIDINTFVYENNKYYSVGEIGYGMNTSIANSPATKKIIKDGLSIESIVFMLEPNIYQINRYAVYPYPFKLVDEFFIMNGGVINE